MQLLFKFTSIKRLLANVLCIFSVVIISGNDSLAHNKVVVIPMAGDDLKPLQNIITVAKANGDFTDPIAALSSIDDASKNNPYLLIIAPGVYVLSQRLRMKANVSIVGAGINRTVLRGFISGSALGDDSALIIGQNSSNLEGLTVENLGGAGSFALGISVHDSSPTLRNLEVISAGSNFNVAISAFDSLSSIENVRAVTRSGTTQIGIRVLESSRLNINTSSVSVSNSGATQVGIANYRSPGLRITNTRIVVENGSSNTGVLDGTGPNDSTFSFIRSCSIDATQSVKGARALERVSVISNTIVNGDISNSASCVSSFLSDGAPLNSDCSAN